MKIIIINGPNLNLLGIRNPEIYGKQSFEEYFKELKTSYPNIDFEHFQSNHEGELIDKIQEVGFSYDAIILNGGGFSHTSVALADAVGSIKTQTFEVHISNIYAREEYRQKSLISQFAKAVIVGFGLKGYELAIQGIIAES